MNVEVPTRFYKYYCWDCDATIKVKVTTIEDMIKQAKDKEWFVGKGKCYCPQHNPVLQQDKEKKDE